MFVFSTKTLIKIDVITKDGCPASNYPIMVILDSTICTHFYFIYPNFVNVFFLNLGTNKFVVAVVAVVVDHRLRGS